MIIQYLSNNDFMFRFMRNNRLYLNGEYKMPASYTNMSVIMRL